MVIVNVVNKPQIQEVETLGAAIWTSHYTPIIGIDQVNYMLDKFQSEQAIANQIAEGYEYYLLSNNNKTIGYLSVQKRENTLFLSKFYIHENVRGQGFGKEAMTFIYNRAKVLACTSISLTVNKYNTNSIEAYKRMGFDIVEKIVFDIGNGYVMDDYRMEKVLIS